MRGVHVAIRVWTLAFLQTGLSYGDPCYCHSRGGNVGNALRMARLPFVNAVFLRMLSCDSLPRFAWFSFCLRRLPACQRRHVPRLPPVAMFALGHGNVCQRVSTLAGRKRLGGDCTYDLRVPDLPA